MTQTVDDRIRSFIIENFLYGDTSATLGDDDSLIENDIVDSTGVLELVVFVEESFGITVDDAEIVPANFDTIARMRHYIASKSIASEAA